MSLAQHIIGGPVRQILGITFASGSLLRSYTADSTLKTLLFNVTNRRENDKSCQIGLFETVASFSTESLLIAVKHEQQGNP